MTLHLTGYKPGDNLTIMNTYKKFIKEKEGEQAKELLTLVYRDNKTGIKHFEEIKDPDYTFYIADEDHRTPYNRLFISKDHCKPVTVKHSQVKYTAAKMLNLTEWYNDNRSVGNKDENNKIHLSPHIFMSDFDIEDMYRFWFSQNYTNDFVKVSKAYFDIEVDSITAVGDFPQYGECEVNAITVIFQDFNVVYTLLTRNPENPQIKEFEDFILKDGTQDLHDFVYNHVTEVRGQNTNDPNFSLGVENFEYKIGFFDKEIDLIKTFFDLMNSYNPDFAMAWNMAFDVPYLIERIKVLGYAPEEIMCHKDFKYKIAEYYIDERARNEPAEKCDFARISSYIVYIDQLVQYASRRKGQTQPPSLTLDYIGELVANVRKLDYKDITTDISLLPYKNYKTFVYYNVCDVISQFCIEAEVEDIDYVFNKAIVNNTRYAKVHRQTVYLANRGLKEFYKDGYIIGNNVNKFNDPPTEKFPGAFVADPLKVSDKSKKVINGHPINVFDNSDDWDYSSLYPSDLRQFNIAAHTQIGMIIIKNAVHSKENRRNDAKFTRGGAFLEDFCSHQWLEAASRWFHLLGYEDLVNYVRNYYMEIVRPYNMTLGFENSNATLCNPVVYKDSNRLIDPVVYRKPIDEEYDRKVKEYLENVKFVPNQSFRKRYSD